MTAENLQTSGKCKSWEKETLHYIFIQLLYTIYTS